MSPIKLAVVGGGPSAFFVASRLLQLLPKATSPNAISKIDIFDRNWAPHGLVRYGVAPDHPEVKNCVHKFDAAAQDPRLRYFGNVNVGDASSGVSAIANVPFKSILSNYSHLLFATGSPIPLNHAAIPPSEHCVPALSFVHWYTNHPNQPQPPALDKMDHVTIIGQGNVALDIARMLLASPSELSQYDVPESVLELLSRSAVKHVSIVGRRGPYEAAFTTKELRELMNLPEASMIPLEPSLLQPRPGATVSRQQSRIIQLLQKGSKNTPGTTPKTWSLDFFRSPLGLTQPSPAGADAHARLTLAHTELDDAGRARTTSHTSVLPTSLVVTSLGHRSEPTHPHYDPALGHVRNVGGRVIDANGQALRHVYTSGWAAMGARGVLASTMLDAHMVADAIIADSLPRTQETTSVTPRATPDMGPDAVRVMNGDPNPDAVPAEIASALHAGLVTTYEDWKLVDAEEVDRGQKVGKERERMGWAQASAFLERARAAHN